MSHEKRPVHEGYYWGIVVSVKDPKRRRRIQVRVPDVLGKTISEWAEPGSMTISRLKVGEKVWIRFLHSDLRYPQYFVPHDVENFAYLVNDEDDLEVTHPEKPVRIRAPKSTAYLSGAASSVLVGGGTVKCAGKDGAGLVACEATEFIVGSSTTLKSDVIDVDFDPLEVIREAPAKLWRYRPEHTEDNRQRIGPVAEELPELIRRGHGVDTTAMLGVTWAAIGTLNELLVRQEKQLTALREELRILKEE